MHLSYYTLALPALLVTIIAQIYVKVTFNKYLKVSSGKNKTGLDAANEIKKGENFSVNIVANQNSLGDYFDPRNNTVAISSENVKSDSVSHVAVVAHEMGHVEQKFASVGIYNIRRFFIPVTNFGTQIGYILFFTGLMLSRFELSEIGLIFFSTSVILSLITIPVELDASRRALRFIKKYDLINEENIPRAKKVLNAAAFTYFTGLLTSIVNVLYYASILSGRKSRK
jgi:hypothetical protein